jgi:hypothetical protein
MPQFEITARKTSPITPVTVEAENRELAIIQVVEAVAEGETVEVLQCTEVLADPGAPPPGTTGTTGTSRK